MRRLDALEPLGPMLPIGTMTKWGPIVMIGLIGGERYYWMTQGPGDVSMMPACVVEPAPAKEG